MVCEGGVRARVRAHAHMHWRSNSGLHVCLVSLPLKCITNQPYCNFNMTF